MKKEQTNSKFTALFKLFRDQRLQRAYSKHKERGACRKQEDMHMYLLGIDVIRH
jgi:hypothetical protein